MAKKQVTGYKTLFYGKQEGRDVGAIIHLYHEGRIFASCAFYTTRQVPVSYKSGTRFFITFPIDRYRDIIDLLRNEKPIYAYFNEARGQGYLSTDQEEAGEGE